MHHLKNLRVPSVAPKATLAFKKFVNPVSCKRDAKFHRHQYDEERKINFGGGAFIDASS